MFPQTTEAENQAKEKLLAETRAENEELRNGVQQKAAADEAAAADADALDHLKRQVYELKREAMERDAREAESEAEKRKLEYLKTEAERENENLHRKLVGCENDVGRLKV